MKPLIMQSSPVSRHFLPFRSKYSPQHPVLKHPQSMFFLSVMEQVSQPYKTTDKIMVFYIIFKLLEKRQKTLNIILASTP